MLNADGSVTYTSDDGYFGEDSFTYTTIDGAGGSTIGTVTVTVYQNIEFTTPPTLPNGKVGTSYTATISTTGGTGDKKYFLEFGVLPGGLHLSEDGVLSGMPQQPGQFSFSVIARDLGQPLLSETASSP